jgi:hypothetical protein
MRLPIFVKQFNSIACGTNFGTKLSAFMLFLWGTRIIVIVPVMDNPWLGLHRLCSLEALDGLAVRWPRTIAEAKQLFSVIGWVTNNLLSRAQSGFVRHVIAVLSSVAPRSVRFCVRLRKLSNFSRSLDG